MNPVRRLALHFALAGAVLAALGAITWVVFDSVIMPRVARQGWPVVQVPDLTGLDAVSAKKTLVALGLEPAEDPERRNSDRLPADVVAFQRPAVGDSVKQGHVVRYWLSAGPTSVTVPDLSGLDSTESRQRLQELGLLAHDSIELRFSTKIPAGKVIGSLPSQGALLVTGARVHIIISAGDSLATPASDSTDTSQRVF